MGERVVRSLLTPNLLEYVSLAPNAAVVELAVPDVYVGRSISEIGIRAAHGVHVIGVSHCSSRGEERQMAVAPQAGFRFEEGDSMLVLGTTADVDRFAKKVARG